MGVSILGFISLTVLSIAAAVFTYIFGVSPLYLKPFKQNLDANHNNNSDNAANATTTDYDAWLRKFSQLSNGVLVSVAIVLIIPEGVNTLYQSTLHHQSKAGNSSSDESFLFELNSTVVGLSILSGFVFMYFIDKYKILSTKSPDLESNSDNPSINAQEEEKIRDSLSTVTIDTGTTNGPYSSVDSQQFPNDSNPNTSTTTTTTNPWDPLIGKFKATARASLKSFRSTWKNFHKLILKETLLIGLLFHSLSDGIAFGSSILTTSSRFKLVVFISIIIHKFPTAFALGCVLVNKYNEKYVLPANSSQTVKTNVNHVIRLEIFIFAMSSSVAAIATYLLVGLLIHDIEYFTAALLLFSGGTFLYVAVHILNNDSDHGHGREYTDVQEVSMKEQREHVAVTLVGMVIPIFFSFFKD